MKYSKMIADARQKGVTSEKVMIASIDAVDTMLDKLRETDPESYHQFIRKTHSMLYGNHYDMDIAKEDIDKIAYTDRQGNHHTGAHWSSDEISHATAEMPFPTGTTEADKYVAFNSFYADTCKVLDDSSILNAAHEFYFNDEDAPHGKIWIYMSSMA